MMSFSATEIRIRLENEILRDQEKLATLNVDPELVKFLDALYLYHDEFDVRGSARTIEEWISFKETGALPGEDAP
jgi:hypothetical protein